MKQNLFEPKYHVPKQSKLLKFYEKNKILIFSIIFIFVIVFGSLSFYFNSKKKTQILIADNYIESKILLKQGEKAKAKDILKKIIFSNEKTYSALSLFLIVNENLIENYNELSSLFDHILENNKYEEEVKNLIIFKKSLFQSNFVDEATLLNTLKPLISGNTVWKPHALLLAGDYFTSKKEYIKAREFYTKTLAIDNLQKDLYEQAKSQLIFIAND